MALVRKGRVKQPWVAYRSRRRPVVWRRVDPHNAFRLYADERGELVEGKNIDALDTFRVAGTVDVLGVLDRGNSDVLFQAYNAWLQRMVREHGATPSSVNA